MAILRRIITEFIFKGDISKVERAERAFRNLKKNVKNTNTPVKNLDNSFQKLGTSLNRVVNLTHAFIALRLVQTASRIVGGILKAAGSMEQFQVAFDTMLGSAEKGKKLMEEIVTFSLETPFGIRESVKGVKSLLAFGESADTVIDSLKILGDIQAGTGADLANLVLAFGQVKTARILRGQEARQLTEAGVPIFQQLEDLLGLGEGEVQQKISAGEVTFQNVRDALEAMTKEGGRFFNLMEKQSKTLLGLWDKLQDQTFLLADTLGKALTPAAKGVILVLTSTVKGIRALIPTLRIFTLGLLGLIPVLVLLRIKAVAAGIAIAASWLIAFAPLIAAIGLITATSGLIGLLVDDIIAFFRGENSAIGIIVDAIKGMFPVIKSFFKKGFGELKEIIENFKEDAIIVFSFLGEKIWEFISAPFNKLADLAKGTIEKVKNLVGLGGKGLVGLKGVEIDSKGFSLAPRSTPFNSSSITNNNSASVGSPSINITIPPGQNTQSLIDTISKGVEKGLQRSLNQSLRTISQ